MLPQPSGKFRALRVTMSRQGAKVVDRRLCSIALHYRDLKHQHALLNLAAFLHRHAHRTDYPASEQKGWPIESFCKRIGLRMKGPGTQPAAAMVSPIAS